jgi:hypothetical protein
MSVEYRAIGQSPLPHLPAKLEDIVVGVISSLSRNCVRIGLFDHQSFTYARNIKGAHFAVGCGYSYHHLAKGAPL